MVQYIFAALGFRYNAIYWLIAAAAITLSKWKVAATKWEQLLCEGGHQTFVE